MTQFLRFLIVPAALVFGSVSSVQAGFTLSSVSNYGTSGTNNPTVTPGSPAGGQGSPSILATSTSGNTAISLIADSPQTFAGSSNVNILDVTATSVSPTVESFSFNFFTTITLTNTGSTASLGSGTYTLSGTFVVNAASTGAFLTSVTNTVISGAGGGFTVSYAGYAAPSPSGNGAGSTGNISLQIIAPSAVPEPASVVLLGLGLVGTVGLTARRRLAAR